MTTQEMIAELTSNAVDTVTLKRQMHAVADRLAELQRQLEQALAERTPHDYGLLKNGMFTAMKEAFEARKERDEANALTQELKKELITRQRARAVSDGGGGQAGAVRAHHYRPTE